MADPVAAGFADADLVHNIVTHLPFDELALNALRISHACAYLFLFHAIDGGSRGR